MAKTYLETAEIEQLERASDNLRDRLLTRLLFHLGCRVSEALALETKDIDFKAGTVTIQHLKSRIKFNCPKCSARLGKSHTFCPKCGEKSTTDVLKIGVGLLEAKIIKQALIHREGFRKGYQQKSIFLGSVPGLEDKMIKKRVKTEISDRKTYERHSRGFICRLDFENTQRMEEYLAKNGCSFSGFVMGVLERGALEGKKMKIIKTPKSNKVNPGIEESSMGLEEVPPIAFNQVFDFRLCPLYCPKCDDQEMYEYLGKEIRSKVAKSWVIVWKCPKCGYSFDTSQSINQS